MLGALDINVNININIKILTHCRSKQGVEVIDPGESEIGQLEGAVPAKEDVLGLDVAVDDSVAVDFYLKSLVWFSCYLWRKSMPQSSCHMRSLIRSGAKPGTGHRSRYTARSWIRCQVYLNRTSYTPSLSSPGPCARRRGRGPSRGPPGSSPHGRCPPGARCSGGCTSLVRIREWELQRRKDFMRMSNNSEHSQPSSKRYLTKVPEERYLSENGHRDAVLGQSDADLIKTFLEHILQWAIKDQNACNIFTAI